MFYRLSQPGASKALLIEVVDGISTSFTPRFLSPPHPPPGESEEIDYSRYLSFVPELLKITRVLVL